MAQTLTTNIVINAKVGNGFSKVGNTLTELGFIVNGVSAQLIEFGSDSLNVYREYEKSMKEAEVALSTVYGRNARELASHMTELDAAATEWAATTIFHTNDVGNAISEAAHAGWNYEQIMAGIPSSMRLAQAGSLDLSEAVNYIVKAASAAGIEFDDLMHFTDLWTFAANSCASDIRDFGEAMLRMGSTMRFAANPEELMTLIAVTANAGSTGSQAGTLIRNSMLRLVAPTKKAREAMAELGATSEETAGLLDDEALATANARLEAVGFSAYDEKDNLKSILDTYTDLYVALGAIAGGYENIDKNQKAIETLSAIFPTRTITEALTLLRGASDEYGGLYEKMMNGAAEGYGDYAAQTMMNTLDGRIEIFESKVERLKQLVGKELSGPAENFLDMAGGFIDGLASMDDAKFSALVGGLEIVAGAGPALLTAGAALRLIGLLLTPAGGIAAGAIALGAVTEAIHKLEEAELESNFGTGAIDHAAVTSHLEEMAKGYEDTRKEVDKFREALDKNVSSYRAASEEFSGNLLTALLTDATLSEADISKFNSLGETMHQSVLDGIKNSTSGSKSYWEMFFGGSEAAEGNEYYQDIISLTDGAYEDAVANAKSIGEKMRSAMTDAFTDHEISQEEYQNILGYIQSYNEAIARAEKEAKGKEDYVNRQMLLHKAQTASLSEIRGIEKEYNEARDKVLGEDQDEYLKERYSKKYDWDKAIEEGREINGAPATEARRDAALAEMDSMQEKRQLELRRAYDDDLYKLWDSQVRQSDLGDAYKQLGDLSRDVLAGAKTADEAMAEYNAAFGKGVRDQLQSILTHEVEAYGGYSGLNAAIENARQSGDMETVTRLWSLYTMDMLNSNFANTSLATGFFGNEMLASTANGGQYSISQYQRPDWEEHVGKPAEEQRQTSQGQQQDAAETGAAPEVSGQTVQVQVEADTQPMQDAVSAQAEQPVQVQVEADTQPLQESIDAGVADKDLKLPLTPEIQGGGSIDYFLSLDPIPLPIKPFIEGDDPVSSLQGQGVQVDVEGDTQSLTATIEAENGKELLEYVSGNADNLEMSIKDQDGKTLVENVHGDASSLAHTINSYNGRTITVNIRGNRMFASGGRATTASIFGEAGPEWAIPEEHSERTAELLNAARAASGFSWTELLSRYAGLNSNTGAAPQTIVYSPTINAVDARGVEQVLSDDKDRLDRWFCEKQLMNSVEVYA